MEKQIDTDPAFFFEQQIKFIYKCEKQGKSPNTLKNYKTDLNCFNNFLKDNNWEPSKKSLSNSLIRHYAHFLDKKYSSDNSRRRRLQTRKHTSSSHHHALLRRAPGVGNDDYCFVLLLLSHRSRFLLSPLVPSLYFSDSESLRHV